MNLSIEQGKAGRFRVFLKRDDGTVISQSTARGFLTMEEAEKNKHELVQVIQEPCQIVRRELAKEVDVLRVQLAKANRRRKEAYVASVAFGGAAVAAWAVASLL